MVVVERRTRAVLAWRTARQASARLSWGVGDQAVCSLTNFLLSIYVARTLGTAQFGAFSLAYVTYGFALNAARGLAIEPLLIRFSGAEIGVWRRAAKGSTGTALLVGIVTGIGALVAGAVAGGTTGRAFDGLGLMLPVLLLQDSWRYAFFAMGRGYHAFINDTVWLLVQVPLMLLLKMAGRTDVFWYVLAWGAGAFVGSIVGAVQAKVIPNILMARQWLVQHRDLGPRYLAENCGGNAASMLQSYGITYLLGLVAIGSIQAAGVLLGPFKILVFGVGMITMPEAARILRNSPRRLPLYCLALSAGLTTLAVAWTVVLLVGLPHGLGRLMLGHIWPPIYPLVLPTALATMASCLGTGASVGLHALGAAQRSLRAAIIGSLLLLLFSLAGAAIGGVMGAIQFAAVGTMLGTLVSWWQFRKALDAHQELRVPGWLLPRSAGKHHKPGSGYSYRRWMNHRRTTEILSSGHDPVRQHDALADPSASGKLNREGFSTNGPSVNSDRRI